MSLTCLFLFMLTFDSGSFHTVRYYYLCSFLYDCFSQEENKLEFSSPFVNGSASPSWVVLVGMDLELIRFILHFSFSKQEPVSRGLKNVLAFVDNFHLFGRNSA